MKNLFTISTTVLLFCLATGLQAQKLASFEDPESDLLILGDKWYEIGRFVVNPSIGDNSAKGGLNTSDNCFRAVNVADANWWGNFGELKLKTPIVITEQNRYLKFLAYRSIQPKVFRVSVNGSHQEDAQVYQGKLSEDAKWQGVVADLGAKLMGQELTSIVFTFSGNWDDPRSGWGTATYMFDDFELSDKPLPPGVTEIEDLSDFYIGFEDQSLTDRWISKVDLLNESNAYEIVDNEVSSDVNATSKVVKFNKGAEASWWQGFRMEFDGALKVSPDYKYLHTMVWTPAAALGDGFSVDVQLCAKDFSGKENLYTEIIWDEMVDEWVDVVMEVNSLTHLSELTVRFDLRKEGDDYVNSPANTFYLDEITLNDDPNPRFEIASGTKEALTLPEVTVSGGKGVIRVVTEQEATVSVFNTVGAFMRKIELNASTSLPFEKGLYLVNLESQGLQKTVKVIVK